ncbi:hypothetical protein SAMN04244553_4025 [Nocardia amikacinitolerans]|uniref:Uncharacterized protein n=3 Tax=Nocardiaceae TaxID=85025 RepID=A0A285LUR1_9NOCA|nr:hypothetical protein [Nocardia amikacinitolerans]MCP2293012.1 hypothetical protein [Nocardia amikacinitolerans]MCP2319601.1 hypothetical protein [Nocardia amikacinitolerans]TQM29363.1 hypothetical protein FB390_0960 [Nocardia bhagyanarayanae]SNY87091.1 hypothetical protein SAMN04244553_4025 [Nocardia amikacinitolerans]
MRRRAVRVGTMRESYMRIGSVIVLIWLLIGVVAAAQRDYFDSGPVNCAGFGTIAVTVIAGPLNYMGVNPKIADCNVPEPSP